MTVTLIRSPITSVFYATIDVVEAVLQVVTLGCALVSLGYTLNFLGMLMRSVLCHSCVACFRGCGTGRGAVGAVG